MSERHVPEAVRAAFADADQYFPTPLQKFQFFDKYSRFDYGLGRRETWIETVDRAVSFLRELSQDRLDDAVYQRIRNAMLQMKAMPSMRLLASAGEYARSNHLAIYNCAFVAVDSIDAFAETLFLSMSGCGVGFSVERQFTATLPAVKDQTGVVYDYTIEDSSEGWAEAVRFILQSWFDGYDVKIDYSRVRPAGSVLRTKGGRASGPRPLRRMFEFARKTILGAQGRQLTPLELHDIMCMVGNAAVSGGHRRTAMISLFDMDDHEMLNSKVGDFETQNSQRWNANNSAVWPNEGITREAFDVQWDAMIASERGEPGIFNRQAANLLAPERRQDLGWKEFGVNPCGEVTLRSGQLCNLSIAVARFGDSVADLMEKVEVATIIGTIQSMATNFPVLRQKWRDNCEEERLLGVDITGQLDCPTVQSRSVMSLLRDHVVTINKKYAALLGINQSTSTTVVKPSGNSSQLLNCSSGLHARWAPYYERNVRVSSTSPIFKVLKDAGVPMDPENGQTAEDADTWVIHFPVKAPDGAITRNDRSAIEQSNYWLLNKKYWTEHNPSVTVTYRPHETEELREWVWEHRDLIGGMAFLPAFDAQYAQLPYIEIPREEYERRAAAFPVIDFSNLYKHERSDWTTAAQELACLAGQCEVDLV
jgi:ribonucleoside-triphosphate reductase